MEGIDFVTASLVWSALDYDLFKVNRNLFHFFSVPLFMITDCHFIQLLFLLLTSGRTKISIKLVCRNLFHMRILSGETNGCL